MLELVSIFFVSMCLSARSSGEVFVCSRLV